MARQKSEDRSRETMLMTLLLEDRLKMNLEGKNKEKEFSMLRKNQRS